MNQACILYSKIFPLQLIPTTAVLFHIIWNKFLPDPKIHMLFQSSNWIKNVCTHFQIQFLLLCGLVVIFSVWGKHLLLSTLVNTFLIFYFLPDVKTLMFWVLTSYFSHEYHRIFILLIL